MTRPKERIPCNNSGYALLEVMADRSLRLRGFRRQADYDWPATCREGDSAKPNDRGMPRCDSP